MSALLAMITSTRQSQKEVTTHLKSKQLMHFDFAEGWLNPLFYSLPPHKDRSATIDHFQQVWPVVIHVEPPPPPPQTQCLYV